MKLLFLFAPLLALLPAHDYHVSKTNLRYVSDRAQVQVEMHLFVEDLELDMAAAGVPVPLEIGTEREHEDAARYLAAYLADHFVVNWNGTDLPLETLGYELADDLHGLWIYLAAEDVAPPASVTVNSSLLTETYPDQKNIVKLFTDQERTATLLMSKDRSVGSWQR